MGRRYLANMKTENIVALGNVRRIAGQIAPSGLRDWVNMPVPSTLDWGLFIGPAKKRPYNPADTPWIWQTSGSITRSKTSMVKR